MKKIVVLDDDRDMRFYLQILLSDLYSVSCFEFPKDAFAEMEKNPPNLILLDISLPGEDGWEILKKIKKDPKLSKIPVVALTGYGIEQDRENYLKKGFNGYFYKPIQSQEAFLDEIGQLI